MKKIFLITILLSFAFIANSCSDDDSTEKSIIGTWKLVEEYGGSGFDNQWFSVENGYTYSFREDNVLISNRFSCNGTYEINSGLLTINFECSENQFYVTYEISFQGNKLILTPNPIICDEGCAEKYKRIN